MLVEWLTWLEASPLGQAVRGAGVWSYAVINLVHIVGVATLFGSVLILDLRMLGLFARVPLSVLSVPTVPMAAAGLLVAAVSGICLLATNATEYKSNPFLLIKFSALAVALVNIVVVHRLPAWRHRGKYLFTRQERIQLALGGGVSLAAWTTVVTAGRMLGYW